MLELIKLGKLEMGKKNTFSKIKKKQKEN